MKCFLALTFLSLSSISLAASSIYDFSLTSLKGKPLPLAEYKGKVMVIVNTASECGYTKQFAPLEKLYREHQKDGFVVIGVPSNSFKQELKSEKEVADFCAFNYGVTFPMTQIAAVAGDKPLPLFDYLIKNAPSNEAGEVKWNFEKFIVDRKGKVAGRYRSATSPDDAQFKAQIKELLAQKS